MSDTSDGTSGADEGSIGEVGGRRRARALHRRVAPQPSQEFDHDFGIEPYSLTYTGHLLLRNALEWPARPIARTAAARAAPAAA